MSRPKLEGGDGSSDVVCPPLRGHSLSLGSLSLLLFPQPCLVQPEGLKDPSLPLGLVEVQHRANIINTIHCNCCGTRGKEVGETKSVNKIAFQADTIVSQSFKVSKCTVGGISMPVELVEILT